MNQVSRLLSLALLTGMLLSASVSVQLTAPASTILVGHTLTLTATGTDTDASGSPFSYQFTVRPHNTGPWIVMQDFFWTNTFDWTPSDQEGSYDVGVTGWSLATRTTAVTSMTIYVASRVTGSTPVISNTRNALVALYSAPPCSAPALMRIQFKPTGSNGANPVYTPYKSCNGLSMNFYVGGMTANTSYTMQQFTGTGAVAGPQLTYTTGSIPSSISIPGRVRLVGPTPPTSLTYPYLLHATIGQAAYATDLNENVVWYLAETIPADSGYLVQPVAGGTFLVIQDDKPGSVPFCGSVPVSSCGDHQFLREFDMAGNVIRQTAWIILNDKINGLRASQHKSQVKLNFISHDAIRLPNGYTVTIATDEQVKNSSSGPLDYFGDVIIVLDENLEVVWTWDTFDYLDVNLQAVGGTCVPRQGGCPAQFHNTQANGTPYTSAVDYTHANSVFYDPSDKNLVISFRNQSWVLKVNYADGTGDGSVLWRLGYGGDLHRPSGTPVTDWFSGQHNARFQANGLLTLFDNNNASPVTEQPGGTAHGQAWRLDTVNKTATLVVDIDLGVVSPAVGSATLLNNGNYEWQAGFVGSEAQTFEFTPSGSLVYKEQSDMVTYRSFRMQDLYTPNP